MRFRRFSEAEKLCGNNYFSKTVCLFHCGKHQHQRTVLQHPMILILSINIQGVTKKDVGNRKCDY